MLVPHVSLIWSKCVTNMSTFWPSSILPGKWFTLLAELRMVKPDSSGRSFEVVLLLAHFKRTILRWELGLQRTSENERRGKCYGDDLGEDTSIAPFLFEHSVHFPCKLQDTLDNNFRKSLTFWNGLRNRNFSVNIHSIRIENKILRIHHQ